MCGCLSSSPYRGPGPQPRHVPWLRIELATFWFAGWHSIHWATPAMAVLVFNVGSWKEKKQKVKPEEKGYEPFKSLGSHLSWRGWGLQQLGRWNKNGCSPLCTFVVRRSDQGSEYRSIFGRVGLPPHPVHTLLQAVCNCFKNRCTAATMWLGLRDG